MYSVVLLIFERSLDNLSMRRSYEGYKDKPDAWHMPGWKKYRRTFNGAARPLEVERNFRQQSKDTKAEPEHKKQSGSYHNEGIMFLATIYTHSPYYL